uniref:Uncharacterized protein n=1 Tax=Arion vulgaris TaxID=1028688 RepID=A0A0B6Y615_9EUPU
MKILEHIATTGDNNEERNRERETLLDILASRHRSQLTFNLIVSTHDTRL